MREHPVGEFAIRVGVATARPPRADAYVYVRVLATSLMEAELTAIYMVMGSRDIVMPVSTELLTKSE